MRLLACAVLLATGAYVGSFANGLRTEWIDRSSAAEAARTWRPTRRVVVLVVDGLAARLVTPERAPNLARLRADGAAAADASTVDPPVTLAAFGSLVTAVPPQRHGLGGCDYHPDFRFDAATVFDVCAERRLVCGVISTKRKLAVLARHEPGVERYQLEPTDEDALTAALRFAAEREPDLLFVHLAGVDLLGHRHGWESPQQLAELVVMDAAIGRFADGARRAGARPLALIVLGDHGGTERSHGTADPLTSAIPWFVWGPGIQARTIAEPVSILDTAPTALALLGLDSPLAWEGRSRAAAILGEDPPATVPTAYEQQRDPMTLRSR